MYATWPMVFGALVAGAVGGLMVPERPASSPSAVSKWASGKTGATNETASKPAEPTAAKPAESVTARPAATEAKPARSVADTSVTPAPKAADAKPASSPTETQGAATKVAAQPNDTSRASCEAEKWPYRTANCLDRTAAVLPAETVVRTKRVDPAVSMKTNEKPTATAEKEKDNKAEAEKPKTAALAPAREEESEPKEKRTERAARAESDERETKSEPARRTTQRRVTTTRRAATPDDEYTGRVYYRDSNGRLYLAPEYRNQLPPPPRYWR